MKKNLLTMLTFSICALAPAMLIHPAAAQTTIKDSLMKHWKVTADFTMAVADKMPADGYGFKPVPEELSFGQLMVQIAGANISACANASGMARPQVPPAMAAALKDESGKVDKDAAVKFLRDTFDFCNQAVASMTPEKLDAQAGPQNRKMTGFEWLWAYFTHTAHHRGQAEVYLRVKGIVPPTYTF